MNLMQWRLRRAKDRFRNKTKYSYIYTYPNGLIAAGILKKPDKGGIDPIQIYLGKIGRLGTDSVMMSMTDKEANSLMKCLERVLKVWRR